MAAMELVSSEPTDKKRNRRPTQVVVDDPVLRPRLVMQAVGMSNYSTLFRAYKDGRFPQPIQLGRRAIGWKKSTVVAWLNERQRKG